MRTHEKHSAGSHVHSSQFDGHPTPTATRMHRNCSGYTPCSCAFVRMCVLVLPTCSAHCALELCYVCSVGDSRTMRRVRTFRWVRSVCLGCICDTATKTSESTRERSEPINARVALMYSANWMPARM